MLERPLRSDAHASRRPSGDHTICQSLAGLDVNRVIVPVWRSTSHRSRLPLSGSGTTTAAVLPSGDSRTSVKLFTAPTVPACLPARSNQVSDDRASVPAWYASTVPSADTPNDACELGVLWPMRDATAAGSPDNDSVAASNRCANSVPSRAKSRYPAA